VLTLTDSLKQMKHYRIGMSRFSFAHSLEPQGKLPSKEGFDEQQILIPTKVQDLIQRSIRTLSNSISN